MVTTVFTEARVFVVSINMLLQVLLIHQKRQLQPALAPALPLPLLPKPPRLQPNLQHQPNPQLTQARNSKKVIFLMK